MREVLEIANIFGALFGIILAIGQAIYEKRRINSYFLSGLIASVSICLFYSYLNMRAVLFEYGILNFLFLPFVFFLGPSTYLYFFATIDEHFKISPRLALHYIPGIAVFIALPLIDWLGLYDFNLPALQFFQTGQSNWIDKLIVVALLGSLIYYYLVYRKALVAISLPALFKQPSARILLLSLVITVAIASFAIYALIARDVEKLYVASALVSGLMVMSFLFKQRHPSYFEELEIAIETASEGERYKTSQIAELDLKEVHLSLVELMNNQKLYQEDRLTVARVAKELHLKPHQLSEFLNKHLQINFSQFVNNFRIDKAARMLREDQEASILSVAYQAGFNSKATFNLAFQKKMGMTPSEYQRSQHSAD